jgi:hypothetical protein
MDGGLSLEAGIVRKCRIDIGRPRKVLFEVLA